MKYIKILTTEKLPDLSNGEKQSHITFAYFGKIKVNDSNILLENLRNIKPFNLKKVKSNLFGPNKDIPVVVYKIINKETEIIVNNSRLQLLTTYNILDQNFLKWVPHISSVDFNECPEIITVIGIQADDMAFSYNF